jgi:L-amino acid N-acyltransferase YncA
MDRFDVVDALGTWTPDSTKDRDPAWRAALAAWAAPSLDRIGDAAWGAMVRDAVGLPVADPLAWADRRIDLPGGGWAVTGIRFRGRDVEKPFVDVIATTATPDAAGIDDLGVLLDHYAPFAPRCLRVHLPGDVSADGATASTPRGIALRADLLVVAGGVDEVTAQPPTRRYEDVTLVRTNAEDAAGLVASTYRDRIAEQPRSADWATPSDAESLAEADEQGLLFEVVVAGTVAGVVAAERDDSYGLTGFSVQEIVLDASHRGQGLGTATGQHLARAIPAGPTDVLWGHVHPGNRASLANAESMGRRVVSSLVWVTPPGASGMPER